MGFQPELNIQLFRVIRHNALSLLKYKEDDEYQSARALSHACSRLICQFDNNKSD